MSDTSDHGNDWDSDNEDSPLADNVVQPPVPEAEDSNKDPMQEELDAEEKVSRDIENDIKYSKKKDCAMLSNYCERIYLGLLRFRYNDILQLILNGTSFIVDGDMLLLHTMADVNWNKCYGGQTLHLVYLFERRLQLFIQKGAIFQIIFFKAWEQAFKDQVMFLLARSILSKHFEHNSSYNVFHFESVECAEFKTHLKIYRPPFMLVDLNMMDNVVSLFGELDSVISLTFYMQLFGSLAVSLPCVDITELNLEISELSAFIVEPTSKLSFIYNLVLPNIKSALKDKNDRHFLSSMEVMSSMAEITGRIIDIAAAGMDIRHFVAVFASACLLYDEGTYDDFLKIYLLYVSLVHVIPLKHRACDLDLNSLKVEHVDIFISKLQYYMKIAVIEAAKYGVDHSYIADIWQGSFFATVLYNVCMNISASNNLNKFSTNLYEDLVHKTSFLSRPLKPFPILKASLIQGAKVKSSSRPQNNFIVQMKDILPLSCSLLNEFCDFSMESVYLLPKEVCDLRSFIHHNSSFNEFFKYWHSKHLVSDELERTRKEGHQNSGPPTDKYELIKFQRFQANYVKYLSFYGRSLGENFDSKPIICNANQNKNSPKKSIKEIEELKCINKKKERKPSKKEQIIEQNKVRIESRKEEIERQQFNQFESLYKTSLKHMERFEEALQHIHMLIKNTKTPQLILKCLLLKCEVLHKLWVNECKVKKFDGDRNINYSRLLLLTVKDVLQNNETNERQKLELSQYLLSLGFDDICHKQNLPVVQRQTNTNTKVGISSVRFQLMYLGPDLDRDTGSTADSRVDGFMPDKWQVRLFDIIDNNESALIVAPTSSGKTYASYYCMKKVLAESNDGVVVYVSPTKALVNQVQATVFSRFGHKKMPPGKAVCGVFTRDYCWKVLECQILITVPQCLEILLLSPGRREWAKRLKYVILDEIHCLAGQAGGISWERCLLLIRCPFLALSATVGEPEKFCHWLQDVENFKRERDLHDGCQKSTSSYKVNLIKYLDRHSDLKKFVYLNEVLNPLHPYGFLDKVIVQKNDGIPSHISLSPSETLELYNVLTTVCPDDTELQLLCPEVFFSESDTGFLSRNEVREYEKKLKEKLENMIRHSDETFDAVKRVLTMGTTLPEVNLSSKFLLNNICNIVDSLYKCEMLPAILFSYDRSLVQALCYTLAQEYEDKQDVTEVAKESRFEKQQKKKELDKCDDKSDNRHRKEGFRSKSLDILEGSSDLKGISVIDENDMAFIERRLVASGYKKGHRFIRALRMGIGFHHGGLNARERGTVEMLFRLRFLKVVFATGTLAFGIHMPCKTVVILGDSHYINALEYQQMSGRAGRRGFDTYGNVVFMGMGERKVQTVLTDQFPEMIGNFPLSVGTVLRLLYLVNQVTVDGVLAKDANADALSRVLTLLNCSMAYGRNPRLKIQMKHFFAFSVHLLALQRLVDEHGIPRQLSDIVTHLHYHEPGNLVFIYLFNKGVFRKICKTNEDGSVSVETQLNLVLLLSHLFARQPLHKKMKDRKFVNSRVFLPELPGFVKEALKEYNDQVKFIFNKYFSSVATYVSQTYGEDNSLPLSGVEFVPKATSPENGEKNSLEHILMTRCLPRLICSAFAALSGNHDSNLYTNNELISNIRHEIFTDIQVVPILEEVELNGYAWDFYNHGIAASIRRDNDLKAGDDFNKLKDFMLVLNSITLSLEELEPKSEDDPVLQTFRKVSETFENHFRRNYYNRS